MAKSNDQHSHRAMVGAKLTIKQKKAFRSLCAKEGFGQSEVLHALIADWMEARLPGDEFKDIFPPPRDPLSNRTLVLVPEARSRK